MKAEKFNKLFLIIAISILLFITTMNYFIDPFGINQRFIFKKINYHKPEFFWHTRQLKPFLSDIIEPNAIFLGNSRIEYLAPEMFLSKISDDKYFNFGLSSGTVNEMFEFLKYAHKQYSLKKVIYGLDFIAFTNFSPDIHPEFDIELVRGNKIKCIEKLKMYSSMQAIRKSISCIKLNIKDPEGYNIKYQYNKYGSRTNRWRKITYEKEGKSWLNTEMQQAYNTYSDIYSDEKLYLPETKLQAYKKIVSFIKNNNIDYTPFISPLFSSQFNLLLLSESFETYLNWLEFIADESGFYYFCGDNIYTSDSSLFWDTQHPRKEFSKIIFNTIYGADYKDIDSLWGKYIDSTNFSSFKFHIIKLRNDKKIEK